MNVKRLLIGSIAGGVAIYIVGYVFWGMIFADFFADNAGSAEGVPRETVIVWASAPGTLFFAALVTMTIEARNGATSVVDGLKAGAIIGFLVWGTADLNCLRKLQSLEF